VQHNVLLYYYELLIDSAIQELGMQDCKLVKVVVQLLFVYHIGQKF
jgi:hypothetical protein